MFLRRTVLTLLLLAMIVVHQIALELVFVSPVYASHPGLFTWQPSAGLMLPLRAAASVLCLAVGGMAALRGRPQLAAAGLALALVMIGVSISS